MRVIPTFSLSSVKPRLCVALVLSLSGLLLSCEEEEDNLRCNGDVDCEHPRVCDTTTKFCKKLKGEFCSRPRECLSGVCETGLCSL